MSAFSIDKKIRCFIWCAFVSGALLFPQAAGSKTSESETLIRQGVPPEILSFKYKKGDAYRTLSTKTFSSTAEKITMPKS